jgi:DNA-binding NarL/FixJ family response regulator
MVIQILIVDDEPAVRGVLRKTLEGHDYSCSTAGDAAEARDCLERQDFELILCDIRMPGESGLDLIRQVRTAYPDTAVIMVTATDDPQEARTALNLGIYGYIIKPFEPNQILISVANALRRRELEIKETKYRQRLEAAVQEKTEDLLKSNEALKKREEELRIRAKELEEANSALKVLLKRREEDKGALEEGLLAQVRQVVDPLLGRLMGTRLDEEQKRLLGILETNLQEIVSPFIRELSSPYLGLTPTQIQVANLIKQGKSIKEIAVALNLSPNTVMSHRYQIRSKFGLLQKKMNLHSFFQSLSDQ